MNFFRIIYFIRIYNEKEDKGGDDNANLNRIIHTLNLHYSHYKYELKSTI